MALPAYVQSSAGAAITGASGTVSLSGCTAGNVIFLQVLSDTASTFPAYSAITNIENLAGTASSLLVVPGAQWQIGTTAVGIHDLRVGRVTADGTCSVLVTAGGTADAFCALHEFTNVKRGTTWLEISSANPGQNQADDATLLPDNINTVPEHNCLAVAFCGVSTNNAVGVFTGMGGTSGATWVERFEFASATGTAATIQVQTAAIPVRGSTLTGGTFVMSGAAGWVVNGGFVLRPSVDRVMDYSRFPKPKLRSA